MKDFWAEELQNQRKNKVRKIILLVIILIIILAILATIVVYVVNSEFRKWCDENVIKKEIQQDDAKYIDIDMDDNVEVYAYDKNITVEEIIFSLRGISSIVTSLKEGLTGANLFWS